MSSSAIRCRMFVIHSLVFNTNYIKKLLNHPSLINCDKFEWRLHSHCPLDQMEIENRALESIRCFIGWRICVTYSHVIAFVAEGATTAIPTRKLNGFESVAWQSACGFSNIEIERRIEPCSHTENHTNCVVVANATFYFSLTL